MKTAMQLAIEHYEYLSLNGSNQAYVVAKFLKENFLEMEKQQHSVTYGNALKDMINKKIDFEQYYNETFKKK